MCVVVPFFRLVVSMVKCVSGSTKYLKVRVSLTTFIGTAYVLVHAGSFCSVGSKRTDPAQQK